MSGLLSNLRSLNRNFVLNVAVAALQGFADSLAGGTVGVAFIYSAFGDSNAKVGFAEALQGVASLATALPAGWAADRWSRSKVIAVGGFTSLAAVPIFGYAVIEATSEARRGESSQRAYLMLCTAFLLFGFGSGIGNGPAQALMADSIPTGQRSKYYNWLFQAYVIPGILGPAIGIVWFLTRGDDWSLHALKDLMLVGISLQLPMAACMFSFRDDRALGRASDAVTTQRKEAGAPREDAPSVRNSEVSSPGLSLTTEDGVSRAGQQDRAGEGSEEGTMTSASTLRSPLLAGQVETCEEGGGGEEVEEGRGISGESGKGDGDGDSDGGDEESLHALAEWVPCIVFSSGLIVALASGMTIKYFPLYFKNTLKMSPASVQGIYVAVPFAMALASQLSTRAGKVLGRVQAVIAVRLLGLAFFSAMVVMDSLVGLDGREDDDDDSSGSGASWAKWPIVVSYVCRTALMNSCYPLEESILMDYAPKATRARWKSLESVSIAGWCGSAFVGGILADHYGYTFTFVITIVLQATGTFVYALLLGVVVVEVDNNENKGGDGESENPRYQKQPSEDPGDDDIAVAVA